MRRQNRRYPRLAVDNTRPATMAELHHKYPRAGVQPASTGGKATLTLYGAEALPSAPDEHWQGKLLDTGAARGGAALSGLGSEAIESGLDAAQRSKRNPRLFNSSGGTQRPDRPNPDAGLSRNTLHGDRACAEAFHDTTNGFIKSTHGADHIRISERFKPKIRTSEIAFEIPNGYCLCMEQVNPLVARLRDIQNSLGISQTEWARRAKRGGATISTLLRSNIQEKTGKPNKGSMGTIISLCNAANFPPWALLHPSDDLFRFVLNKPAAARLETTAIAAAIAMVDHDQSEAESAAWNSALLEVLDDDRRMRKGVGETPTPPNRNKRGRPAKKLATGA